MSEIELLVNSRDELGEGPLWHPTEGMLYWVDIERGRYHRLDPVTMGHEIIEVGERLGVLGFRARGGMVLAGENGFAFFDPHTRVLERIADPEADRPETRFNDGAVDRRGRFWAGTLGITFQNSLYRLDPDLSLRRMETGIDISNGIGWSPDNRVMYYVDSTPQQIYAYDFDLESGEIANRRVFVDRSAEQGVPDGLTVDADGGVWIAVWEGACVEQYDPQGKLVRRVSVPALYPTSVAFGGAGLDELYVTSALVMFPSEERGAHPQDGGLFRLHGMGKGLPEPFFAG